MFAPRVQTLESVERACAKHVIHGHGSSATDVTVMAILRSIRNPGSLQQLTVYRARTNREGVTGRAREATWARPIAESSDRS